MKNKVKPTAKQKKAFEHLKAGLTKQQAMLKAGYSPKTALNAKQNLMEAPGTQVLIHQYREELRKAGVTTEVLAEVEAAGLFEDNPNVRLEYLKEAKKSLGINTQEMPENLKRRVVAEEFFND